MDNLKGGGTGCYNITILNKQWVQTLKLAAVMEEAKPQCIQNVAMISNTKISRASPLPNRMYKIRNYYQIKIKVYITRGGLLGLRYAEFARDTQRD